MSKKTLEQLVFRLFWTLTRKTCSFTRKFLSRLSKLLSTCPEEHFQSNISERKSWKLQEFRIIFEVFGTMAANIFRVGETAKDVQGNSPKKKFFKKRRFRFFPILSAFLTSGEKLRQICQTRNLRMPWSNWGKSFSQIYIIFHTSLDFDPKNAQSESFFTSCHNCNPRVQRHFLIKSNFSKKSFICSSVLEFEQFFFVLWQKKSGCQRNNLLIQKKEWRKEFVDKSFFKSSSDFQQKSLNN